MLISTKGLMVHKTKYADHSLIVKIFTEKCGLRSFLVKGAFSKKSKFRYTLFSPLALLEITFDLRNHDLLFLKEVRCCRPFQRIPFNMARNSLLIFYNELIYKSIYQCHEDPSLFFYLEKKLQELDGEDPFLGDLHLRFMIGLFRMLGVGMNNNYSEDHSYFSIPDSSFQAQNLDPDQCLSLRASRYLSLLLAAGEEAEDGIVEGKSVRMELLRFLLRYMEFHIPGFRISDSPQIWAEVLR